MVSRFDSARLGSKACLIRICTYLSYTHNMSHYLVSSTIFHCFFISSLLSLSPSFSSCPLSLVLDHLQGVFGKGNSFFLFFSFVFWHRRSS